jgi:hypothetical protein
LLGKVELRSKCVALWALCGALLHMYELRSGGALLLKGGPLGLGLAEIKRALFGGWFWS